MTAYRALFIVLILCVVLNGCNSEGEKPMTDTQTPRIVFAAFAETSEALDHIYYLAESLREFGGTYKDAPLCVYVADYLDRSLDDITLRFAPLRAEVRAVTAPDKALWFYFAAKVFAAARAEADAAGTADILVWLDEDTIILDEPAAFNLDAGISFAYRPVMHNRSGTLYGQPPNDFWARIYDVLNVNHDDLFPMITPADKQTVNTYFNAGLVVVRPEKGILRKWADDFTALYTDSVLVDMCKANIEHRIFLHQTALVGAVLNTLKRGEMVELPDAYNYPLFFEQMFGANQEFGSIEGIKTLRYDVYFRDPDPQWQSKLKGPEEKVSWLAKRLGK